MSQALRRVVFDELVVLESLYPTEDAALELNQIAFLRDRYWRAHAPRAVIQNRVLWAARTATTAE
jgi:hypothetical protein